MLLEGDRHVVNCIQPHPTEPSKYHNQGISYFIQAGQLPPEMNTTLTVVNHERVSWMSQAVCCVPVGYDGFRFVSFISCRLQSGNTVHAVFF